MSSLDPPDGETGIAVEAFPADELEHAIAAIGADSAAHDSAAIAARYRSCGLEVLPDPNDGEVALRVARALTARAPFSVIRMNDGEMALLAFGAFPQTASLDRYCAARSVEKQADRFRVTDSGLLMLRDLMFGALAAADIVGVVGLWPEEGPERAFRFPSREVKFFEAYRAKPKALHGDWRGRTYMPALAEAGHLDGKTIASGLLYFGILEHLDRVVDAAGSVLALTPVDAAIAALRERYPLKRIDHLAVGTPGPGSRKSPMPEFLSRYEAALPADLAGVLCLIGAGPWAELYCTWIKRRGGVAVDLGSGFDLLAGNQIREPHRKMQRRKRAQAHAAKQGSVTGQPMAAAGTASGSRPPS